MFALELTNIIGLVTALVGFMWCLGPIRSLILQQGKRYSNGLYSKLSRQWQPLYYLSTVAFFISGFLTDGILVSGVNELIYPLLNYTLLDMAL